MIKTNLLSQPTNLIEKICILSLPKFIKALILFITRF